MNSDDVILLVLDRLRDALSIPVEFKGETDGVDVPGVVVTAEGPRRLSDRHGASTYAGPILDSQGNETAEEHHVYQSLGLDVVVQTNDREERADVMETVAGEFFPYEGNLAALGPDFHKLTVGDASARDLMLREPAQYVYGRVLNFEYLQRFSVGGETLAHIPYSADFAE